MHKKRSFHEPEMYVRGIRDLDPKKLQEHGIRLLLVDFDNTLMESRNPVKTHGTRTALRRMKEYGITPVIMSNNFAYRCKEYAETCGVDYRAFSLKPLPHTYRSIMKQYGCRPEETAAIGDQILTDMLGAYLSGVIRILSDPLSEEDNLSGSVSRWVETRIFAYWKEKYHIQRGEYYDHL
ncbi:MAG: YqeG family HAD IIIA-type phosphatase [Solobacterium sp.]|nr:YqeG family HAD IIIA-type phosphatase [Solobacterium sp.]